MSFRRISLTNTTHEGENNVYLLTGDGPTTLIDTGDRADSTREQLEAELAADGLTFADVEQVLVTHWHYDHMGLARDVQAAGGATVRVHARDAGMLTRDPEAMAAFEQRHVERMDEWGMPEEAQAILSKILGQAWNPVERVEPFENGEQFRAGDHTLRAVHAPGHADGLAMFVTDDDEVFSGDALLPVYTPNVGGADLRVERPLERYLETLLGIVAADYDRAWPGHRDPIDDPAGRADAIITHHEERAYRVLRALSKLGTADPWAVGAELFGDLEGIHLLHGPGESFAHLDHLTREGVVERTGDGYRLAPDTRGRLDAIENERWPLVERDGEGTPTALL